MEYERPYEPLGMTTALWRLVNPTYARIADLTHTNEIDESQLDGPNTSHCGDPIIHVVNYRGVAYIADGNHRVARARKRGVTWICARVLYAKPGDLKVAA